MEDATVLTHFHRSLIASYMKNLARAAIVLTVVGGPLILASQSGESSQRVVNSGLRLAGLAIAGLAVFDRVLPLALLTATLFTIGSLARHNELVAMRAVGCSTLQILWPVVAIGLLAVLASAVIGFFLGSGTLPSGSGPVASTETNAARAYPVTNLVAVLVGVVLAVSRRPKSKYIGFNGALFLLIAYYFMAALATSLGRLGVIPPVVAGWSAPVVFTGMFVVLWWRIDRSASSA